VPPSASRPAEYEHVHDPGVLRAIAHPLRNRILTELTATGPMRAADIARKLDIPANQASFHLRQLARYGLVEEDRDAARDRRDRVWKPTSERGLSIDLLTIEGQPGGEAASAVFRRSAAAWGHVVVDRAYQVEREPGTKRWVAEQALRLTKDEADEMVGELDAVARRWAERTRGTDGERRTYLLYSILQPYPEERTTLATRDERGDAAAATASEAGEPVKTDG
jgi:DNA-binding transcriptional ArsR family regulator